MGIREYEMKNTELREIRDENQFKHSEIAALTDSSARAVENWFNHDQHERKMPESALALLKIRLAARKWRKSGRKELTAELLELLKIT